ncbi:MobF family relaxase, partial [Microlunatus ginsengisoli]|uniref:MobF family relaxase n=1 Tax=Microlunatus ginsengisoli TaxID=363863 RepID=UPI0031DE75AF
MTASLHKLTAGDGYTYLTRQVAVTDSTQRGRSTLADYYTEKGERPGRWVGHGVTGLGTVHVGDHVSEAQMRALFGEGRHPDADALQKAAIAAGDTVKNALKATQLGRAYPVTAGEPTPFLIETQRRYQAYNAEHGRRLNHPVPEDVRAAIRTEVGRATFEDAHGRPPADAQEFTSWVTRQSRRPAQAVAGFDVTFTPVKSVSTLWAVAPRPVAEQIEAAHEAAVDHALQWLEAEVAHTRRGAQGVRQTEVTGIVATAFTHRDSRNGDPNLHTHVAIANKVQDRTDGAWLSLDGAALYRAMVTVSEHYNSHLEAELAERLGSEFEEVTAAADRRPVREIVGVPAVLLEAWSSRRVQIEAETDRLARQFGQDHGRAPTAREMIQLAQQANLATRQAKHEPRSLADQRRVWRAQAVAVLGSDQAVDAITTDACRPPDQDVAGEGLPDDRVLDRVAEYVTETVSRSRARWQPTHVMAEAYRQLRGLNLPSDVIDPAVAAVTDRVLNAAVPLTRPDAVDVPDQLRRSDGSSVYEPKHTRLYTTTAVLDAEARIVDYALRRDGRIVDDTMLGLALLEAEANGQPLNDGQQQLVQALARSGQRVQLAIAPAGSGKTTAMRTLSRAWVDSGGTVIGLAPSAVAADELRAAVPDGTVETLAKLDFLLNLSASKPEIGLAEWVDAIDADTLVLIDEAGMAGTTELAAVIDFVIARGGSVRLIGDDRQLAAVAAGGVLRDIQEAAGSATLAELMRFVDPSEAAATLAVRDGDPAAVGFYLDRGRLHDTGDPTEAIVDAWWADTTNGRSALMIAATRETTARLNEKARERRIGAGLVDAAGPEVVLRTGLPAAVGDRVLTRRNDRRNRLSATDFVKNGDRWTVVAVDRRGRLKVSHERSRKITWLDADYVRVHVDHAYAVTVHSAQGSTVDVSHVLLDGTEDRQTAYVALSRGRFANHVYVRTAGDGDPHNRVRPEIVRPSTGAEILHGILEHDGTEQSASTTQRLAASPQDLLRQHALRYLDGVYAAAEDLAGPDQLRIIEEQAEELQPGITGCGGWPQLRMMLAIVAVSGEDPIARLREVRDQRDLGDAQDVAAVLGWRLDDTDLFAGAGPLPWLRATPEAVKDHPLWGPYLNARAELVAYYAAEVADQATLTVQTPRWAEPVSHNRRLWRDLAVWRAATAIPTTDPIPTGTVLPPSRERNYQVELEHQVETTAGPPAPLPAAVLDLLREEEPAVLRAPFWQTLARRLSAADRHGQNL